ncbi:MAG: VWA domain-containing protein [Anaerolineales bacterium]|nr:VWA domain-containing protein [Anaerolineales bacterium]MCK5633810.1 VWA domain-containing protein [Anaerolineales bacterium]
MFKRISKSGLLLAISLVAILMSGCAGAMDASKAISRGAINRGVIVQAESVRVNEYLNYYEQRFPEPIDQILGLDLRLGNTHLPSSGGEIWLQIGLQAMKMEASERTPLNLALVLDASGSMDSFDKMPYLKQSLMVFLESLQPDDIVSIVTYSTDAWLLRPAQDVGNGAWIRRTVEKLRPGGITNLHAGLMLGLKEVDQNFDIRRSNRVILLTDGIANEGVTNPDRIAADALAYNDRGIFISTIGLGYDLNDDLLSTLARQGKGAYHFVDSAQEMEKVFIQEVEGLVEKVAADIRVSIRPISGAELVSVTGFDGRIPSEGVQVQLQDMGAGDSQVIMVRLQGKSGPFGLEPIAEVTLQFVDVFAQKSREISGSVALHIAEDGPYNPLADIEVLRNATIVKSAEALKNISDLVDHGRFLDAWQLAYDIEAELRRVAAVTGDAQMVQDADLFQRYLITLVTYLGYDPSEVQPTNFPLGEQPQRWGATPMPPMEDLPTIEVQ